MSRCISLVSLRDRSFRSNFKKSGLRSTTTDIGNGTVMRCWIPKKRRDSNPNLLLIHGFGPNALWQWADIAGPMTRRFNVYVPELVFFGESYSTRPERTDTFQAQCVMKLMEAHGASNGLRVVGLSYGGFVAYSLAAQFPAAVERVVICCAAVCLEEKDIVEGRFNVADLETAAEILLPQTPEKLKELMEFTLIKPPKYLPTCFLKDFIQVMCKEHLQERKDLIHQIPKNRNVAELPKIPQVNFTDVGCGEIGDPTVTTIAEPTLIIWGDQDKVFPLEFGHRLKRHLGDNAELVVIKNAAHAFNIEKPKEFYKHLKAFLVDSHSSANQNGK